MINNTESTFTRVKNGRKYRSVRWARLVVILGFIVSVAFSITLVLGQSFTSPSDVLSVLLGHKLPGASFVVGQLRLPRAVISLLVGMSFGMAGVAFQIMLRNPLASPDIIGVSAGATAAAVFAITMLHLDGASVALFSISMGLLVALSIYGLSYRNGVTGTRLILIGIGVSAMIESITVYLLSQAQSWDRQEAIRWLSGSVNSAQLSQAQPLLISLLLFGGFLLSRSRDMEALRMGDDTAQALGINVNMTRITVMVSAVGLIAVGVAITGPIAFVAFLSGPIAMRLIKNKGALLLPSGFIGACLVLTGDYIGQFLLPSRYPVGVITGALGAPYLIYLIIRVNRKGGSL
ncbi:iron ABC transporter permease [Marinomonas rhizomae]|uniref:Iron complex transport system permease protein n=1 Tax=Marinomonas rhizomae TaxID=491948 RepID=A0A366J8G7_9GAMM|nr:iron chelate uptake ABC transporter family permease subunit [Marinomonas rhizomae]RBP83177.1 iron complex transport system permease protein [Marinomonas rhizomae]RNF72524.1 iron ABC transporter permease [Marinomonas rhizomae]